MLKGDVLNKMNARNEMPGTAVPRDYQAVGLRLRENNQGSIGRSTVGSGNAEAVHAVGLTNL
jgi:hypothetical protein